MIKAMDEYDDLLEMMCLDPNEAEEYIIKYYLVIRLNPLLNTAGINRNKLNNIIDFFTDNYLDYNYSLDIMVNALYNYINKKKTCPSNKSLSDDIETFLKDYANE